LGIFVCFSVVFFSVLFFFFFFFLNLGVVMIQIYNLYKQGRTALAQFKYKTEKPSNDDGIKLAPKFKNPLRQVP